MVRCIVHRPWRWSILVVGNVTLPMVLRMLDMVPGISVRIIVEPGKLGPGEPVHSLLAHNLPDKDTLVC